MQCNWSGLILNVVLIQPQMYTVAPFYSKPSSYLRTAGIENMFCIISKIKTTLFCSIICLLAKFHFKNPPTCFWVILLSETNRRTGPKYYPSQPVVEVITISTLAQRSATSIRSLYLTFSNLRIALLCVCVQRVNWWSSVDAAGKKRYSACAEIKCTC